MRIKAKVLAAVQYARGRLYDYYGTVCHCFPVAHEELIRIKSMSPDEILYETSKKGFEMLWDDRTIPARKELRENENRIYP